MENKEEFRLRNKQINFRVTEYEYNLIQQRLKESEKKTLREYLLDVGINGYVIKVDYKEIKELAHEINKIGVNINQIAHKVNSGNQVYKADIEEVQEDIDLIWRMLRSAFYQIM